MITPQGVFDGITDNAPIINAAIDAAYNSGGGDWVQLSPGPWGTRSPVYPKSGVKIVGAYKNATRLIAQWDGSDVIKIDMHSYGAVRDLTIQHAVPRSSGASISTQGGATEWELDNIGIDGPLCGLSLGHSAQIWANKIAMTNVQEGNGIGTLVNGGNDHHLDRVFAKSRGADKPCYATVRIQKTGALWMNACGGLWAANGCQIDPPSGSIVEHIFSSRNAWDSCSGNGMLIQPAGGIVRRSKFVEDWTATCKAHGVATVAAGTIDDIGFIGHRSLNNGMFGFYTYGSRGLTIDGATVAGNSGNAIGVYSGIYFEGGTNDFAVLNSRSGNAGGFSTSQPYGLYVAAGASNRYRITGNDFSGNSAGGMHDGGTGTNKIVSGNILN